MKYTYIKPELVKDMPEIELLQRCQWLIESVLWRHMRGAEHGLEDARQELKLVLLRLRLKYRAGGVNFEGWAKPYLINACTRLRIQLMYPVSVSEQTLRRGRAHITSVNSAGFEDQEMFETLYHAVADNTVELRSRQDLMRTVAAELERRMRRLRPEPRALLRAYINEPVGRRQLKKYDGVADIIKSLRRGLEAKALELLQSQDYATTLMLPLQSTA